MHAGGSRGVGIQWSVASVSSSVCVCLHAKRKRPGLSISKLVKVYSIVSYRHALTWRLKGQRSRSHDYENRHGRMAAGEVCCCCCWRGTAHRTTAWVSSFRYISGIKAHPALLRFHRAARNWSRAAGVTAAGSRNRWEIWRELQHLRRVRHRVDTDVTQWTISYLITYSPLATNHSTAGSVASRFAHFYRFVYAENHGIFRWTQLL